MKIHAFWSLALPLSLWAPATLGQSSNHQAIEELVITASPHGKTSGDIAGAVNVLSGETLSREAAATLGETLKGQTGISSSSFGPGVGLPVIRGLSGSRVEVLQNNNPVTDASETSPDHAIASEPLLADRIEILRGPATLRYGPGAIGGVVNIIDNRIHTDPHTGVEGAVETRFDNNGNGRVYVGRVDGGNGPLNFHVSGVTRERDDIEIPGFAAADVDDPDETTRGFVANTDAETDSWNLGFAHVGSDLVLGVAMSRLDNNYGVPPGGHGHHEHGEEHDEEHGEDDEHEEEHGDIFTRIDMRQTDYSGKLLLTSLPGHFNSLTVDLGHSDYRHRELEIGEGFAETGTRYSVNSDYLRAELTLGSDNSWLGAVGIQGRNTEFKAVGEEAFVQPNEVRIAGAFVTGEREVNGGTLSLGMRYDHQSADPREGGAVSHDLVNASASYLLPVGEANQLSLVYSLAQRGPSAEELFASGEHAATRSYQVGSTTLDRETSHSLELTWSYEGPVTVNASLFHREFTDFIYEAASGERFSHHLEEEGLEGGLACSANLADFDGHGEEFDEAPPCFFYRQEDARFSGAEVEMIALVSGSTSMRLWGDTVRARLDQSGDVPRIPPARIGANLDYSSGPWVAGVGITHGFEQNNPGSNESATDSFSRVDAHLSWSSDQWHLFLKGSNLTDQEIRNSASFLRDLAPEPGRSIMVGGRYIF